MCKTGRLYDVVNQRLVGIYGRADPLTYDERDVLRLQSSETSTDLAQAASGDAHLVTAPRSFYSLPEWPLVDVAAEKLSFESSFAPHPPSPPLVVLRGGR